MDPFWRAMTAAGVTAMCAAAGEPEIVKLWPSGAPDLASGIGAETLQPDKGDGVKRLTNVTDPRFELYRPEHPNGTAVVVCPGGGYNILAFTHEGTEVCSWLNGLGVTAALLKYRVPNQRDGAFQDVQRAIGIVRSRAKDWTLAADRIGVLGFSAGGHLAARISTHAGARTYARVDAADDASCRPDFSVLVYPAYLLTTNAGPDMALSLPAGAGSPPAFLVHAADDGIPADNSLFYYRALRQAKIPAELHVYAKGGHGFGMKPAPPSVRTWPDRCADWMRDMGLVPEGK